MWFQKTSICLLYSKPPPPVSFLSLFSLNLSVLFLLSFSLFLDSRCLSRKINPIDYHLFFFLFFFFSSSSSFDISLSIGKFWRKKKNVVSLSCSSIDFFRLFSRFSFKYIFRESAVCSSTDHSGNNNFLFDSVRSSCWLGLWKNQVWGEGRSW